MGLGRKKKELKLLEEEKEIQKQAQESIISYLSNNKPIKEEQTIDEDEDLPTPIRIISKEYKRLRRFLRFKNLFEKIKEIEAVVYIRRFFLSYIGIAVTVFVFAYFVKFSITNESIDIYARFGISTIVNLLLIVLSHLIRKKYKTFSSILLGGAMGSLYISFTVSFYIYEIFSNFQIFSIFLLLTMFSVGLSYFYNRFELILIALLAGFVAPLFSNFDFSRSVFLLIYIIILDIGAIIISSRYRAYIIRLIPALFTGVYLFLWMKFCIVNEVYTEYAVNFLPVTIIYFLLIILAIVYNVRIKSNNFQPYELMMVLMINLIYYTIGMYMLNELNPEYKGIFTGVMAVFNMLFLIVILLISKEFGEKLIYFFAIISLLFLTLIPPVELVGKSITMIWAVETVLLMWVSLRLQIQMLKLASSFLMLGLIASFLMDFFENYMMISSNAAGKELMINKSFISGLMTSFGLGLNVILINKSRDRYL
ncbi:MAG: DUF2339 domain-containing protein, partial [Ignavibacteriaceae bacterium]|nr:DUF2339 domain-containing protein [Ignavibacteriaceae bacterium]